MDPLAKVLNPPQLEAVRHGEGPLLILAGAGSGKTRVLTHRIAHLLRERLARAPEILAVTFTNKAAGELRERVTRLVGPEAERLWVATFHAAGARILRREAEALGLTRSFAIYDDADQLAEVKRAASDLGFDTATARQHLSRIDRWKNAGVLPGEVRVAEYDVPGKTAAKVYARYQAALQASNAVDFGDLIVRVIELFKKRDDVLQNYAGRFRHILVDEFQDTNPAQYQLLKTLASVHGNLGVVGDDDQSIYRWRGAEVDNILDFPKHFPGTKVVRLEQNYRSSGRILAAAHAIIEKNERRAEKKLWTAAGEGDKVRVLLADDERDEGSRVASELYGENARGTSYAEMAVFYRANAQSRALEDALRARRVPYRVVRGRSFYDRAEVKDIAAYLRLCVNPRADGDLLRIVNTPPRGIGDTTVEHLRASANRQGLSLWEALSGGDPELPANARNKLAPFKALVDKLREGVAQDAGAADAIERVIEQTGYADRLRLEGEEGEDRLENLMELVGAAREFDRAWAGEPSPAEAPASSANAAHEPKPVVPNALTQTRAEYLRAVRAAPGALGSPQAEDDVPGDRPDPAAALAAAAPDDEDGRADTPLLGFLEQLALVGDADAASDGDRVSLMTLHAAKGLEFDAVWMTGMEERVFPSSRSLGQTGPMASGEEDPAEMAEERRLCYVGMTRARKRLTLSLARCRSLFGELRFNPPSRFVRELPPGMTEGLAALERLSPMQERARKDVYYDEFDQRTKYAEASPIESRNRMRESARHDPASKPIVRQAAPGTGGLGAGSRVKHPSFGVGMVEDVDGEGLNRKLVVRFGPGVGLKKVLARFIEKA
ncbi:MAG TPA: UvrD-helicase domain-containing protein [Myxococcales bacterium]|nr:UvrD-helicase domain-containing protein [Myxococcales bacterium]